MTRNASKDWPISRAGSTFERGNMQLSSVLSSVAGRESESCSKATSRRGVQYSTPRPAPGFECQCACHSPQSSAQAVNGSS